MENNFENKLNELEKIVSKLEGNEISLDEAIKLFEDGVKLSDDCRKILENAERKIKTLTECEGENND
ncbi:MAG: exodeoxyribonuclease VII small subunit [Clostridia bacterium]|jgi:exodeoxyribonuclease VII small subunit|nr:exodeoxyribonuclease VII small subunit [Clostridia bacterium]